MEQFFGRITSIPGADGFGFIGIASVTKEDGSPHGLATTEDIFLHQDDCSIPLKVGVPLMFEVVPDRKREGAFRAIGATQHVATALIPVGEAAIPGFAMEVPSVRTKMEIARSERLPVHRGMKQVPRDTVNQVVENQPMPRIPRDNDIPDDENTKEALLRWLLSLLFTNLANFGTDFRILDSTDVELDRLVDETAENYRAMGIEQQIEVLRTDVASFKGVRKTLAFILEENLVRRDSVIPIQYLPDLFMAVPVWYFWVNQNERGEVSKDWNNTDPRTHQAVKHFCGLFPSQKWYDTFQLFNRRVRTLQQYKGETIPPEIARRMRKAVEHFDYVVIATPYHDQAGKDWQDIDWLRAIDPYILGFKKGVPFFFVLGRYSDVGTFPLMNELVADTIEFLRTRKQKLQGFNQIRSPYWCQVGDHAGLGSDPFGDYLMKHVDQLLVAFETGTLFDWLRGDDASAPAK